MERSEIPEGSNPFLLLKRKEKSPVDILFDEYGKKNFFTYVAGGIAGIWETIQAMKVKVVPHVGWVSQELTHPRAQEGIRKIIEQNVGQGTIAILGFFAADLVLQTIAIIGERLGKKGIDPDKRFLASLTFGVATASYLETTTFLNNTVDLPDDLFGVALSAAVLLAGRVAQKHLTIENLKKLMVAGGELSTDTTKKLYAFSQKLSEYLKKMNPGEINPENQEKVPEGENPGEINPENLATEFLSIMEDQQT